MQAYSAKAGRAGAGLDGFDATLRRFHEEAVRALRDAIDARACGYPEAATALFSAARHRFEYGRRLVELVEVFGAAPAGEVRP